MIGHTSYTGPFKKTTCLDHVVKVLLFVIACIISKILNTSIINGNRSRKLVQHSIHTALLIHNQVCSHKRIAAYVNRLDIVSIYSAQKSIRVRLSSSEHRLISNTDNRNKI